VSRGSLKAGQVPAPNRAVRVGVQEPRQPSVWLNQEEESVQLAPGILKCTTSAVEETVSNECNLWWFVIDAHKSCKQS
jgi:hypothetical protein